MNKKGFAVSTMLYGLIFVTIAVFYLMLAIINSRREQSVEYTEQARESIRNIDSE